MTEIQEVPVTVAEIFYDGRNGSLYCRSVAARAALIFIPLILHEISSFSHIEAR